MTEQQPEAPALPAEPFEIPPNVQHDLEAINAHEALVAEVAQAIGIHRQILADSGMVGEATDESLARAAVHAMTDLKPGSPLPVAADLDRASVRPGALVMPPDEFEAIQGAARTFGMVAAKPCGCGPDEPCAAHADTSPSVDWQGRAEAAEAKVLEYENAITWGTSCLSCARVLDQSAADHERAEYWHKRWTAACERADEDGVQAISQHVRIGELERRAEAAEAKLSEVRSTIATFIAVRGSGQGVQDLAEAVRQVLDREEISSEEDARNG